MEGTDYFAQSIGPGKSVTVPIDFEGSTYASLMVFSDSKAVKGSFRGTALTGEDGLLGWALSYTSKSAGNGDLVLTNTGPTSAGAYGFAYIQTRRHLVVETGSWLAVKGQPFTLTASLSQATDADGITASIILEETGAGQAPSPSPRPSLDLSKAMESLPGTPISMTKVSTGRWTATVTVPQSGTYRISAQTTGSHQRSHSAYVTASNGDVTLGPGFTETPIDRNGDRLIDELDITVPVTSASPGPYSVRADLLDSTGTHIASADYEHESLVLVAGKPTPLTFRFNGSYIYAKKRWGPYQVQLTMRHVDSGIPEFDEVLPQKTLAYDYLQFWHDRVKIDEKSIRAVAVDTDNDGMFEGIEVTGSVTLDSAMTCDVGAGLEVGKPWKEFGLTQVRMELSEGVNHFKVLIKGADIAKAGRDGPYEVVPIEVFPVGGDGVAWGSVLFTTPPYKASQFH